MADGFGIFLAIAGFAVLLVLLARCSTPREDLIEAWHRHEARDIRRERFDRWMASAIYDPDWQSHWGACDRQLESVRVVAMESLRAKIKAGSGDAWGPVRPANNAARRGPIST